MKHHSENDKSELLESVTATCSESDAFDRGGLGSMTAGGTLPVSLTVSGKNDLLSGIEARLAEEVSDLARALRKFSAGAQSISEELPLSSEFGKLITRFFSASSLQLADALLQGKDRPLLLDDGAMQLHELGLGLNDFIREITLEGRQFLAIALVDKRLTNSADGGKAGD
ncbi:hypothetical protein [Citrobacter braakii]|uniref:hypothetical protein n=1 Tax=Citrobacter braakii TaxID=57706 RepID=UPI000CDD2FCB|nr:hypothetical protein [Citrobacter braakii]POT29852.1 hypothetical protein C3423_22385 [Citrobacter braakii]POT34710.1 hypothetical protein C3431_22220 [Citrobacter braakii]POT39535.1 hypothetical protein C3425_22225 [Citrobacter braakii]POU81078.1 hypothetical protein C3426_22255 [Citrobacter braakii]POV07085.1 hypothetical protein C3427_22445 [Citrobacter braakii]